jgi:DNA-binding transcriptional regulator YbjK
LSLAKAYLNPNDGLKTSPAMTRPSEITRERILTAAERLFAERGYEGTSIRAIVAEARVNQAAINYHFAGKDGSTAKFCAPRSGRLPRITSPTSRRRGGCRASGH